MDTQIIERNFNLQRVREEDVFDLVELSTNCRNLALFINNTCPESREKSLAFTKLEEAYFWAREAIQREAGESNSE